MKYLLSFLLLAFTTSLLAQQNNKLTFTWDKTPTLPSISFKAQATEYLWLERSSNKVSRRTVRKFRKLSNISPTVKNYQNYYSLAWALWEEGIIDESEKLFLSIFNSTQPFYTNSYFHSSDIPGDTSTNSYRYGSYMSNYQNLSCRFLCRIYLEKKQYATAFHYISLADTVTKIQYNCGTGDMMYRKELNDLKTICYFGLEEYQKIIDLRLQSDELSGGDMLISSIKKLYTQEEISDQLKKAETSIYFIPDTTESITYASVSSDSQAEISEEIRYTSGTGSTVLFGKHIILPRPVLNNGETATREHFIKEFTNSWFYVQLMPE